MIYKDNIFNSEECKEIRELVHTSNDIAQADRVKEDTKVFYRNSITLNWDISHLTETEWIFYRITDWCKSKVNVIKKPNRELYVLEYLKGHYLERHNDVWENYNNRAWTFVCQLSEPTDYTGSETLIYTPDGKDSLQKEIGSCILFPAKLDHEATKVLEGTRYSLVMCYEAEDLKSSLL
jgi:hypothetical protein